MLVEGGKNGLMGGNDVMWKKEYYWGDGLLKATHIVVMDGAGVVNNNSRCKRMQRDCKKINYCIEIWDGGRQRDNTIITCDNSRLNNHLEYSFDSSLLELHNRKGTENTIMAHFCHPNYPRYFDMY